MLALCGVTFDDGGDMPRMILKENSMKALEEMQALYLVRRRKVTAKYLAFP